MPITGRPPARSPLVFALLLGIVISLSVIMLRGTGAFEFLELYFYDIYEISRVKGAAPDKHTVLIKISEADIQRSGRWPMTDAVMADILEKIEAQDPAVVGLDIYRDIPVPPGSDHLREVFSRYPNIISVKKIGDRPGDGIAGPFAAGDKERVAFNDILVDPDGVVRRGLLFMDDGETTATSFSLLLAAYYLRDQGIVPEPGEPDPQYLRLGKTAFVPLKKNDGGYITIDARGYQYLLDMKGSPQLSYPLAELLAGTIPSGSLSKKIVLLGVAAESLKDFFYTPLSRASTHPVAYGIEMHASMAGQIVRAALEGSRPVTSFNEYYEWIWIAFWGFLGSALGMKIRSVVRFFILVSGSMVLLAVVTFAAFHFGWWLPLAPPALTCLASAALITSFMSYRESADRKLLMQIFSRFVSEDVADAIWAGRDQIFFNGRLRPQKLVATVLFTDIKGFTSISEKLDPQALMDWLNEYMDHMARVVMDHGGVINKYIGDAVMAVFGVPLARSTDEEIGRDALSAVHCALAMREELDRLNSLWTGKGLPSVAMRIGISTGPLIAGCLGSEQRLEYTVIGDTVNTASRLESLGKDIGPGYDYHSNCRILISEATLACLGSAFATNPVGNVSLKGKEKKIQVHAILGPADRETQSK